MTKEYSKFILFFISIALAFGLTACKKEGGDGGINIFSLNDDIELGKQLEAEIASNPAEYPVLDSATNPIPYAHLYRIRDSILNAGQVKYKDLFSWKIRIIQNDSVLNAFAAPGGYIYVYTGIIKFLDAEHELAGVLAHEIAHADRRHSTDQLTRTYGIQTLLDIVLGTGDLSKIAGGLIGLRFSRKMEAEADEYSVIYLCPTEYRADGAAAFFQKIGASGVPEFLSTHPDPGNRVNDITDHRAYYGCIGVGTFDQRYMDFKNSLP